MSAVAASQTVGVTGHGYWLGIDVGTTYTAAAVSRGGSAELVTLGNRTPSVPSIVHLGADGSYLFGDVARRKGLTEPTRVAREFKRRLGDPTPFFLGGSPLTSEALTAKLLQHVVATVAAREGADPSGIVLAHPATWGEYKREVLLQAARRAGLPTPELVPEPVCAALHYAATRPVPVGDLVAVYDLGGGTFDVTILRADDDGFSIVGEPSGVDQLGGVDFDHAVMAHVDRSLGDVLASLDPDDPSTLGSIARLRDDVVEAKELLSADSEAAVPVVLPNRVTEVRITRREYEDMIRPLLVETTTALHRAMRSAGVVADQVARVVLVGGSSRTPVVAQLLSAEFARPITIDIDPTHAVALGAAMVARARATGGANAHAPAPASPPENETLPRPAPPNSPAVDEPVAPAPPTPAAPAVAPPTPAPPTPPPPVVAPSTPAPPTPLPPTPAAAGPIAPSEPSHPSATASAPTADAGKPEQPMTSPAAEDAAPAGSGRGRLIAAGAALLTVVAVALLLVVVLAGRDDAGDADTADPAAAAPPAAARFDVQNGVTLTSFATAADGTTCRIQWALDTSTLRAGDVLVLIWRGGIVAQDDAIANASGTLRAQIDELAVARGGTVIARWSAQPAGCV